MCVNLLFIFFTVLSLMLGIVNSAQALPWDIDMYRQESLQSNEVARAPAEGTVPLGYVPFSLSAEEAGKSLRNQVGYSRDSVWRGKRLWKANCLTCHGAGGAEKGPVGSLLPVPNLQEEFYRNRPDGHIFAVIHNGGAVMPRYGYKLSTTEHWDLVNYVRFLQGKALSGDVSGLKPQD